MGSGGLYHSSRISTGKVVDCFGRTGTGTCGLYRISKTGTETVVDCIISVGLVMGQLCTMSYQ